VRCPLHGLLSFFACMHSNVYIRSSVDTTPLRYRLQYKWLVYYVILVGQVDNKSIQNFQFHTLVDSIMSCLHSSYSLSFT